MELRRRKALPWIYWAQVTLIIVWLTQLLVLFETDCYYTVYLLCGVMGIVSLTAMRFKDGFQVTLRQNIGLLVGAVLFQVHVCWQITNIFFLWIQVKSL